MVATATASYFLLTADYGPEPNVLDPVSLVYSFSNCFADKAFQSPNFGFSSLRIRASFKVHSFKFFCVFFIDCLLPFRIEIEASLLGFLFVGLV